MPDILVVTKTRKRKKKTRKTCGKVYKNYTIVLKCSKKRDLINLYIIR